jgi:phosphocarrier protein
MIKKDIEITNRLGLHARAAAKLVHTAGRYSSEISLIKDGDSVDAKSILGILQLGAAQGTQLELACDGDDERDALDAVSYLFADRFGEES